MSKISGDPYEIDGTIKQNVNGAGNHYCADAFDNKVYTPFVLSKVQKKTTPPVTQLQAQKEPLIAQVMQDTGATAIDDSWNKNLIVANYKAILTDVESLKVAINHRDVQAANAAIAKLREDAMGMNGLIK